MPRRLRRGNGVEDEACGVGTRLARDKLGAAARRPDFELIDRRGTERVAGGQHDGAPFGAEFCRQLADGRGLAGAVDADDQDDERLLRRIDDQRLRDAGERFLDLRRHHGFDFIGRGAGPKAGKAQRGGDLARGVDAEIGANEHVLDLVDRRRIELAFEHDFRDGFAKRRGAALEPAGQAPPPIFRRCGRAVCRTVLHAAPVIAVSPR